MKIVKGELINMTRASDKEKKSESPTGIEIHALLNTSRIGHCKEIRKLTFRMLAQPSNFITVANSHYQPS